jgi:integrase
MTKGRRGRGEGTIYPRPGGGWTAQCSVGVDGNGKRLRRTVSGKTKSEVQLKLREIQNDADSGISTAPVNLRLALFLRRWLEDVSRPRTGDGAHRENKRYVERHIVPIIGGLPLAKVTPQHVRGLLGQMERNKVGAPTRGKVLTCLKQALRDAVRDGTLRANPADAVDRPRVPTPEQRHFTAEHVGALLDAAADESPRDGAIVALLCGCGARVGEVLALRWKDVDIRNRKIDIQGSLVEYNGRPERKEPKTKSSRREIDLPAIAVNALVRLRQSLQAPPHGSLPVFTDRNGGFLRKSNLLRRWWHPLLERAGLPQMGFHAARHAHATALLGSGASVKDVSARLGHSRASTTLDVYAHAVPGAGRELADRVDSIFGIHSR